MHRDVNNLCAKAAYGRYGQVQADRVQYPTDRSSAPTRA